MPSPASRLVLVALVAMFLAFGGLANLLGPKVIIDEYIRWGYPRWFRFVTGALELATAALLAFLSTRRTGAVLGCLVMLAAVGTVILHREYAHAIPGLVVLALLALIAWS